MKTKEEQLQTSPYIDDLTIYFNKTKTTCAI